MRRSKVLEFSGYSANQVWWFTNWVQYWSIISHNSGYRTQQLREDKCYENQKSKYQNWSKVYLIRTWNKLNYHYTSLYLTKIDKTKRINVMTLFWKFQLSTLKSFCSVHLIMYLSLIVYWSCHGINSKQTYFVWNKLKSNDTIFRLT